MILAGMLHHQQLRVFRGLNLGLQKNLHLIFLQLDPENPDTGLLQQYLQLVLLFFQYLKERLAEHLQEQLNLYAL